MKPVEIKKDIYWVGGIDWDLRDFHGYSTERGTTYNAYLIIDKKITLVDTVKHYLFDELIERIKHIVDPSRIDYIITNHVEMDHSGSLPKMMELCRNATVIASPNGEKGLKKHFRADWDMKVVSTGDSINIGKNNLHFVLTPMLHWPDSMVTYIPEEKLLLPNDAFGQHLAASERFDDEVDWGVLTEEAAKYYANIVLPFGSQVKKALEAVSGLDIDMIAPSHGIIWRKHIKDIIEMYAKWSNNDIEEKAVIVYDTMWNSTKKIADSIYTAFEDKGIPVEVMDLKVSHISDIMTQILTAKYVCVGSPTLNNGMLPTVAAFLTYMKGLAPKNRKGLAFGSYGWGGQSVGEVEEILALCGFDMMESIRLQWVPGEDELKEITDKVRREL